MSKRHEPVGRRDLVDEVVSQLRTAILTGGYAPGDLLPPERDLADQFGVDRHTLRSALTELEHLRLIHRRQGSGSRVLDYRETGTLELLKHLVVKPGTNQVDPDMVGPVVEVGRVTLQGLIDLVVDRADATDLDAMVAALDQLRDAVADGVATDIVHAERRFHGAVFRGTQSIVAELLVNSLGDVFDAAIDPQGRVRLQWGDEVVSSGRLADYERVIEAIGSGDHPKARLLIETIMAGIPAAVASADAPAKRVRRRTARRSG